MMAVEALKATKDAAGLAALISRRGRADPGKNVAACRVDR